MKFEYIRKTDKPLMEYGHMLSTGDTVDLPDHLAQKALKRPLDYKKIEGNDHSKPSSTTKYLKMTDEDSHLVTREEVESDDTLDKPRRGRPPKVKDGDES